MATAAMEIMSTMAMAATATGTAGLLTPNLFLRINRLVAILVPVPWDDSRGVSNKYATQESTPSVRIAQQKVQAEADRETKGKGSKACEGRRVRTGRQPGVRGVLQQLHDQDSSQQLREGGGQEVLVPKVRRGLRAHQP